MENLLTSFSKVEYLTIFATFIYGYVATQSFYGWGSMITHRKEITFSKEHFIWTVITFFLLIDIWWGSWLKGFHISESRVFFYLSLISPVIFYIISIIQFPPLNDPRNHDLKTYFAKARKYNYYVFILLGISFYLNDVFLQDHAPATDFVMTSLAIILATVGLITKHRTLHTIVLGFGAIILIYHIFTLRTFDPAEYNIQNFSVTEYLTIFSAFIYGAVASRFFSGWGSMVYNFQQIKVSKVYLGWTIFTFVLLMDVWYSQWDRERFIARNIGNFLLSLSTPIICYFVSIAMFPRISHYEETDLGDFFEKNRKIIYSLLAMILVSNLIVANVMEESSMLTSTNILRVVSIVMAIVGIYYSRLLVDRIMLILAFSMVIFHAIFPES